MNGTYNQMADQILKSQNFDRFHFSLTPPLEEIVFDDDNFLKAFNHLKKHFQVLFKFVGEENFKLLVLKYLYDYTKYSVTDLRLGLDFPVFLASHEELQDYPFLQHIASLDWFWYTQKPDGQTITLPMGTLSSWTNLSSDNDQIDIQFDFNDTETLTMVVENNEYKIKKI